MEQEVFKLVSREIEPDGLTPSYSSIFSVGRFRRFYQVGIPTFPLIGSLFAFKEEKYIWSAIGGSLVSFYAAFRAIAQISETQTDKCALYEENFYTFWEDPETKILLCKVPIGTILCDSITLIEEVML